MEISASSVPASPTLHGNRFPKLSPPLVLLRANRPMTTALFYQTPFSYCLLKWSLSQLSWVFSRLNKSNLNNNSLQVVFCETSYQSCYLPPDFLCSLHLYSKSGVWVWGLGLFSTPRTSIERVLLISLPTPRIFLATTTYGRLRLELVLYRLPWHSVRTLTWFLMCIFIMHFIFFT